MYVCFQSPSSFSSPEAPCTPPPPPAYPMLMAFASTFLCSQEIYRLASMVDAHLPNGEEEQGHILPKLPGTGGHHS